MFQLFLCSTLFTIVLANPLITPCKFDDENCIINEATKVQNTVMNGYKPFKIPKYNPFTINLIEVEASGLYMKFNPIQLYGFDVMKFQDIQFDTKNKLLYFKAFLKQGRISGPYRFKGSFGPLSFDGEGPSNITVEGVTCKFNAKFDIIDKNGREFVKITNSNTNFDVQKVIYNFQNLVKGNEALSKLTNDILNANWGIVVEALGGQVEKMLNSAFSIAVKQITDNVPLDELILS